MDPNVGDFERGDVLIEGDTISRIGPGLGAESDNDVTTIVDAEGCIVMPGFVDTHRHMWQGQLRRMIPNVDISMYLGLRNAFAIQYEPSRQLCGNPCDCSRRSVQRDHHHSGLCAQHPVG